MSESAPSTQHFREIPYMGVIYVVAEAMKLGYENGHPDWCNLGQGQPEVGEMAGAPPRFADLHIEPQDQAYGPIGGTRALREAVAAHYNRLYRQGKRSQYTADHVSIAAGGRLVLTRLFAALADGLRIGYQVPDYTAYEDLFAYHQHRLHPVALAARAEDGFRIPGSRLTAEVDRHRLGAFLLSNPCNPTGAVIAGAELGAYVDLARRAGLLLVLDEFYSHFIYDASGAPGAAGVSAAAMIDDVDEDPVVLIDGLTKSFRYPGWRLGWAVGPRRLMDTLGRAASALDGGPSQVVQRAAPAVLEPARADQETRALRQTFARKRNLMVEGLGALGIRVNPLPEGTFYAWASVADLPAPLNDEMAFFRAALEHKVLTVPGSFFDVNPGKLRSGPSPFRQWLRFSYGPPEASVRTGLARLAEVVQKAR